MAEILDGRFFRAVWAGDDPVEYALISKAGFAICAATAMWSLMTWAGQKDFGTAAWSCLFYIVGGVGVRRHSVSAAGILLLWHLLGQAGDLLLGFGIGVLPASIAALLVLNLRNTWVISARLRQLGDDAVAENKVAVTLWRIARYPFLIIGTLLVGASLLGTVMAVHNRGSASSLEPVHRTR